jgi:hypothetical protein
MNKNVFSSVILKTYQQTYKKNKFRTTNLAQEVFNGLPMGMPPNMLA